MQDTRRHVCCPAAACTGARRTTAQAASSSHLGHSRQRMSSVNTRDARLPARLLRPAGVSAADGSASGPMLHASGARQGDRHVSVQPACVHSMHARIAQPGVKRCRHSARLTFCNRVTTSVISYAEGSGLYRTCSLPYTICHSHWAASRTTVAEHATVLMRSNNPATTLPATARDTESRTEQRT